MKRYDYSYVLDYFLFSSYPLVGIGLAVVISVYVGTEYSDGTLRNKLVVGRRRTDIYLSNVLVCMSGALLASLLTTAATTAVGYPLFGGITNSLVYILELMCVYYIAVAAYASIYNLIAMLIANKTHSSIINILLAFALMFFAIYLYERLSAPEEIPRMTMTIGEEVREIMEPNPSYLTGMKREVFQFFMDLTPSGQMMEIVNLNAPHPLRMLLCSLGILLGSNALGVFLFRRMDIR